MQRLLFLVVLAGLVYGGYVFSQTYTNSKSRVATPLESRGQLIIKDASDNLGNLATVLGASIENTYAEGKSLLSQVTGGSSEPIINQLVTKTQDTLKDLPQKEADRIKYEFCRGVIEEYERE